MDEVTVRMEADVNPTEDEAKVKMAVANLFGDVPTVTRPSHVGRVLTAEAQGRDGLENLGNLLRRDRVRSAARVRANAQKSPARSVASAPACANVARRRK